MELKRILFKGKISWVISQIIRYFIIAILLTISGVVTAGIGTIIAIIFYKAIQKWIPFNISIHKDIKSLQADEITIKQFFSRYNRKIIYNYIIFGIPILIPIIIFIKILIDIKKIFSATEFEYLEFSIFFGVTTLIIGLLVFHINYFKLAKNYVKLKFPENSEIDEIINKKQSLTRRLNFVNIPKLTNLSKSRLKLLNDKEIIIITILLGTLSFSLVGYLFGKYAFYENGVKVFERSYFEGITNYNAHIEFEVNYTLGIISFITVSGILYIWLSRYTKKKQ
jgi:hypothetical protein